MSKHTFLKFSPRVMGSTKFDEFYETHQNHANGALAGSVVVRPNSDCIKKFEILVEIHKMLPECHKKAP